MQEKELDFQIVVDPSLPKEIILDEIRFRQIFLNLLSNAIKFTDKGYIRLTATYQTKKETIQYMDLIFTVEDTGVGIPEEEHDSILRRSPSKRTEPFQIWGTGLGLAISNRLVQLMNGSISVKSQVDKGSVFQIILQNSLVSKEISHKNPKSISGSKQSVAAILPEKLRGSN